jgi:purine-binding chemotaxis protein CheW
MSAAASAATDSQAGDIQFVIFRLGNEDYGIDISQVREIIRVGGFTRLPGAPGYMEGIINLRGQITTVINLRDRLGMERDEVSGSSRIIILNAENASTGLLVDYVSEVKSIQRNAIEEVRNTLVNAADSTFITGVAKTTDGLLILIDPRRLIAVENRL